MKQLYLTVYKIRYSYGKTHLGLYVENERDEWSYESENGISSNKVGRFNRNEWSFHKTVLVGTVPDITLTHGVVENLVDAEKYAADKYNLITNNCWVFVVDMLKVLVSKPEAETFNLIYSLSDEAWNPYFTGVTYFVYGVLWYYCNTKHILCNFIF